MSGGAAEKPLAEARLETPEELFLRVGSDLTGLSRRFRETHEFADPEELDAILEGLTDRDLLALQQGARNLAGIVDDLVTRRVELAAGPLSCPMRGRDYE